MLCGYGFKVISFEFYLQMTLSIHTLIILSHVTKKQLWETLGVVGGAGKHCVSSGFPEVCVESARTCNS